VPSSPLTHRFNNYTAILCYFAQPPISDKAKPRTPAPLTLLDESGGAGELALRGDLKLVSCVVCSVTRDLFLQAATLMTTCFRACRILQ
jgi:hypothetical protein